MRQRLLVVCAMTAAAIAAPPAAGAAVSPPTEARVSSSSAAAVSPSATAASSPPTAKLSYYARIVTTTIARSAPSTSARAVGKVRTIAPWNGEPMQLLIVDGANADDGREWLKVLLARKPNGSHGWIPADYAQVRVNRWRLRIDRSRRRVTVFKSGKRMRSSRVVVGARATPTPLGAFAIREVVRQPNPRGFAGPWILHLNANSERLKSFDGGDGVVGIHGRGGAALSAPLGSARSHGCIRTPNSFVRYLARHVVAGTPVEIRR